MAFENMTITKSTDGGAPSLTGVNGSFNDFLNTLLIAQGNWTREYHNAGTNESVFRANTGSIRPYFYVRHDSSVSGNAAAATVRGAESATGYAFADLTDVFPTVAQQSDSNSIWSIAFNTSATNWEMFAWDRGFILFVDHFSQDDIREMYLFGELPKLDADDDWCAVIATRSSTHTASSTQVLSDGTAFACATNQDNFYFMRDATGTIKSSKGGLHGPPNTLGDVPNLSVPQGGYKSAVNRQKLYLNCLGSATATVGANAISRRCAVPNVWAPLHDGQGSLDITTEFQDSTYDPAANFGVMPSYNNAWCIVELTDTWAVPSPYA